MSVCDSRGVPRYLRCVWEGVVVLAAMPHTGCGEGMRAGDQACPGPTLVLQLGGTPAAPQMHGETISGGWGD